MTLAVSQEVAVRLVLKEVLYCIYCSAVTAPQYTTALQWYNILYETKIVLYSRHCPSLQHG